MRISTAFTVLWIGSAAFGAQAAEPVEIRSGETALSATLFRPAGAGPFPAVVALHGCEGLTDPKGALRPQYRAWGERLLASRIAVIFPDSFGARGLSAQCRAPKRPIRASRERVTDAQAARQWLQSQPFVNARRISLLGWSNGANTALWTVRPRRAGRDARNDGPDFRSAAAFYPNCRRLGASGWSARIPTLILVGAADDWAPAHECEQMVAGAKGRSAMARIVSYSGAYHFFDRPDLPLQVRTGLAFTPDGSGRAHVGSDAEARTDAIRRVGEFFLR